jgi:hypothetical protein
VAAHGGQVRLVNTTEAGHFRIELPHAK